MDGVNDGQQVYSYTKNFSKRTSEDVNRLFTYQVPSLPQGVTMTEEVAKTMPASFFYRFLSDGTAAIALNTYLGRDYMGSAGRFGNYLSHAVVYDFDALDMYPSEIYGSSTLRSEMAYDEVNNPKGPDYLPEPVLEQGYQVNIENVISFLGIGNNLDHFKVMVAAMLTYPTERRRILISDEPENTIMWIAALHYALPLDLAKKVNFTTYEYAPELSTSQICGVISEGSKYQAEAYVHSEKHYVFDFKGELFNEITLSEPLIDFLEITFRFSYDSLKKFHQFVMEETTYREAGPAYYDAYNLYSMLAEGLSELTQSRFTRVVDFVEEYADHSMKLAVIQAILEDQATLNSVSEEYALVILHYLLKQLPVVDAGVQEEIKEVIVNRIIALLARVDISEADFLRSYDALDELARSIELSIPAELMEEDNRAKLLNLDGTTLDLWKVYFVARVMSEYVLDTQLGLEELHPDRPIGNLYYSLIGSVYSEGRSQGIEVVEQILDHFKPEPIYLINMAFNMECFLKDLERPSADIDQLWAYFTKQVLEMPEASIEEVNEMFLEYKRYEEMFLLYSDQLKKAADLPTKRVVFLDTLNNWFVKSKEYKVEYLLDVLAAYQEAYKKVDPMLAKAESEDYAKELLDITFKLKLDNPAADFLIAKVMEPIELEEPSFKESKLIEKLVDYQIKTRKTKLSGKLLQLEAGIQFERIATEKELQRTIKKIQSDSTGVNLMDLSPKELTVYFEWVLKKPLALSLEVKDYVAMDQLFDIPGKYERIFMEVCHEEVYERCKKQEDYEDYATFLTFMFKYGEADDLKATGKSLGSLSKQKLEDLDSTMKDQFKEDAKALASWDEVREIASDTNPLLNNIANLFRRRRK